MFACVLFAFAAVQTLSQRAEEELVRLPTSQEEGDYTYVVRFEIQYCRR